MKQPVFEMLCVTVPSSTKQGIYTSLKYKRSRRSEMYERGLWWYLHREPGRGMGAGSVPSTARLQSLCAWPEEPGARLGPTGSTRRCRCFGIKPVPRGGSGTGQGWQRAEQSRALAATSVPAPLWKGPGPSPGGNPMK